MATRADVEQARSWLQALRMTALVGLSRENVAEHAENALEIIDAARLVADELNDHGSTDTDSQATQRLIRSLGLPLELDI